MALPPGAGQMGQQRRAPPRAGRRGGTAAFCPWDVRLPNLPLIGQSLPCTGQPPVHLPTPHVHARGTRPAAIKFASFRLHPQERGAVFTDPPHHILKSSSDKAMAPGCWNTTGVYRIP